MRKWCVRGAGVLTWVLWCLLDMGMSEVVGEGTYLPTLWDIAFFVGCVGIGYTTAVLGE